MINFEMVEAATDDDYWVAKALIEECADALRIDLSFQNFAEEVASLRKVYGPPQGNMLLARIDTDWAGCVAIRNRSRDTCEMKRLYVRRHGIKLRMNLPMSQNESARSALPTECSERSSLPHPKQCLRRLRNSDARSGLAITPARTSRSLEAMRVRPRAAFSRLRRSPAN